MGKIVKAILILLVLALIYQVIFHADEDISFKDFTGLLPVIVLLLDKTRSKESDTVAAESAQESPRRQAHPEPSIYNGIYGGLLGGAVAGLIMGFAYTADAGLHKLAEIFIFSTTAGMIFGVFTQVLIFWFRKLVVGKRISGLIFNELTGGIIGGAIAGVILGGFGGWYFESNRTIPANIILFEIGIISGAIFVPMGTLFYSYRGEWRNTGRVLTVTGLITLFVVMIGIIISRSSIPRFFLARFFSDDVTEIIFAAAILGLFAATIVGAQVGLVLLLYRLLGNADRAFKLDAEG